jgi:hypothetical protein
MIRCYFCGNLYVKPEKFRAPSCACDRCHEEIWRRVNEPDWGEEYRKNPGYYEPEKGWVMQ